MHCNLRFFRCHNKDIKSVSQSVIPWGNKGVAWRKRQCKEQCQVHEGEEGQARPGWTTSRRGQDFPWKSQSGWQRTEINGDSTSVVWPALGSRTAKEQNRIEHFSIGNGQPCREPTSCICTLSLPTQTATAQRCASVLLATALCLSVCLSVTSRAFCWSD